MLNRIWCNDVAPDSKSGASHSIIVSKIIFIIQFSFFFLFLSEFTSIYLMGKKKEKRKAGEVDAFVSNYFHPLLLVPPL